MRSIASLKTRIPDLEEEDVREALAYAVALAHDEVHSLHT